jgi:hypothetical protein
MGRIWHNIKQVGKTTGHVLKILTDSVVVGLGHPVINSALVRNGGRIRKIIAGTTAIAKEIYRWTGYDVDWGGRGVGESFWHADRVR